VSALRAAAAAGAPLRGAGRSKRTAATEPPLAGTSAHMNRQDQTRLLTADELGQRWQVRAQHVYALARDGDLPHVRIGRYVRFRLESIEVWEAEQEATHA
jgi:excisionase family DNA binding protein